MFLWLSHGNRGDGATYARALVPGLFPRQMDEHMGLHRGPRARSQPRVRVRGRRGGDSCIVVLPGVPWDAVAGGRALACADVHDGEWPGSFGATWHLGHSLHRFAMRSAGLRSMFQQVFVQVGLGLAQEEYLHPWMQENAHHRVQCTAALAVLSLTISLPDAGSASRLGPLLQTLRARANRPSTSLTVSAGFGRIEGHGSSLEDGVRALPMSEALLRWGHLASRPLHLRPPVNPLSGTSEAGDLSRARLRSLAATSKASAAPSGSPAACPALAQSSAPVPRPPAGPPPDALLASRNMGSDSRRVRPRPSRQAGPEYAEDF